MEPRMSQILLYNTVLVTPYMATKIWVNIGSGNRLLLDGTKSQPGPMLTTYIIEVLYP